MHLKYCTRFLSELTLMRLGTPVTIHTRLMLVSSPLLRGEELRDVTFRTLIAFRPSSRKVAGFTAAAQKI